MFNHEPPDYDCSICQIVRGENNEDPWTKQTDVFLRGDEVTAFVNPAWWGSIEGNVVVVPNRHVENIFDLPSELAAPIQKATRDVATAFMETYGCPGVSTRQHNGPAGNQEVWHYHLHVFPRYERTDLYGSERRLVPASERQAYADRLRRWFEDR